MKARIRITLKNGVLDPQGKAIQNALASLGFSGVERRPAGQVHRGRPGREPDEGRRARAGRADVQGPARQHASSRTTPTSSCSNANRRVSCIAPRARRAGAAEWRHAGAVRGAARRLALAQSRPQTKAFESSRYRYSVALPAGCRHDEGPGTLDAVCSTELDPEKSAMASAAAALVLEVGAEPVPDDAGKTPADLAQRYDEAQFKAELPEAICGESDKARVKIDNVKQVLEAARVVYTADIACPEVKFLGLGERRATVQFLITPGAALSADGACAEGRFRAAQGGHRRFLREFPHPALGRRGRDIHGRLRRRLSRLQLRSRREGRAGGSDRTARCSMVWHGDASVPACDLIVLPGGFAYGDYLRCGAMAAHSPIMRDVVAKAKAGTPVLGICNGFQVLCETGLLPGVLMRNASLKFVCRDVHLKVEQTDTLFTSRYRQGRGDPHPHRARRRQLLRRRGDARRARGRRPRGVPLRRRGRQGHRRRQPQRRPAQHRRHLRSLPAACSA